MDVGGAYDLASGIRFGLVIENLLNVTSWDDANLVYYRKQYRVRQVGDQVVDSTISNIEKAPYNAGDPLEKALHDSLTASGTFPTRIRAGVNVTRTRFTVAGGITLRAKRGLDPGAAQQLSAGAELRPAPVLALRAGLSSDLASGMTLGGGIGLKLGPVRLDAALANTLSGDHKGFQVALGASIMN